MIPDCARYIGTYVAIVENRAKTRQGSNYIDIRTSMVCQRAFNIG